MSRGYVYLELRRTLRYGLEATRSTSAQLCRTDFTDRICPYMGQGEYPLTLFIDPQPYKRIGCAKYGQKHLHAKVSNEVT